MSYADDIERTKVRFSMTLLPVRQRAILVGLLVALAIATLLIIGLLVTWMWLDLTIPLPTGLRRLLLLVTALSAIGCVAILFMRARRTATEDELAKQIDETAGGDGTVMAGFDLMSHGIPNATDSASKSNQDDSAISLSLAAMAADNAEQFCERIDPVEVVSTKKASLWWRNVGIATAGVLIIAAMLPRLAWTQAQRILIPMESQLPYSPTSLTVEPGDTEVIFGSDLEITTSIAGPLVEDLELVLTYDDESEETLPLLAETDDRWRTYLTRVTRPANYFVRATGARSAIHRMDVRMTPEIESVRCVVTPPEYTRRSKYEGPLPDTGFRGLAGTKVEIVMASNRPLKSGTLELDDGKVKTEINLAVIPPNEDDALTTEQRLVRGGFTIARSGRFRLSVTDVDGVPSADVIEGVINVLADEKPVIKLLQPKPISLATPNVPLPIVIAAEDDYGLTRLELFRGLNQSTEIGTPLQLETGVSSTRVKTSLPLAAYGLEPGDEITLFARVEDNDPDGAKGAESAIATVRIISQQQLAELEIKRRGMEALLSKQRAAQRELANLQKQLDDAKEKLAEAMKAQEDAKKAGEAGESDAAAKTAAAEKAMKDAMKELGKAAEATSKAAESIRQSADVELPVDLDKELNKQLKEMAEKMDAMAERMQELKEKMESGEQLSDEEKDELNDLMQQAESLKKQHQDSAMNPTERMSRILPLAADQQRFTQLARRQRSLADRLESLQASGNSDPATKRRADDLRREQQQLQVSLSKLLEDIEDHVQQLPADPELDKLRQTASEFVENVRASQADPAMTQTQEDLLADRPQPASEQATNAAETLESFLSQCNAMGNEACQNCEASFSPSAGAPKPGNSISQLLQQMGLGQGQSGMNPGSQPGMKPGPGQEGAGGGYSMPQNTMENIGVYGGLPVEEAKPRRGNGEKSDGGFATYDQGGDANLTQGGAYSSGEPGARGDSGAVVPSTYKKQVSDYFRQIAEELGDL